MKKKLSIKKVLAVIFILIVIGGGSYGIYFLYRTENPKIVKDFQDPFLFKNGSRVATADDWAVRRSEIKDILLNLEYGNIPDHPDQINAILNSTEELTDSITKQTIILTVIPFNNTPSINFSYPLWLYIPSNTTNLPAIIKVSEDGKGSQIEMGTTIPNREYVYACYDHEALDPDTSGYDEDGPAQMAYPAYDWGSLGVWAWGAMRVADYLIGEEWVKSDHKSPSINTSQLIVTGHSRRGKTALLAGALDERFAMVVPNGSGCGGAGSFLVQGYGAESIASITSKYLYKSWFHEEFGRFSLKEKDLPFDQHFLRALVAPRIIMSSDGLGDDWANPVGTQAVYEASLPVFSFLNATNNSGIHFREGGHGYKEEDFKNLMDFADKVLLGKEVSGNFYMKPYNTEFPINYAAPN